MRARAEAEEDDEVSQASGCAGRAGTSSLLPPHHEEEGLCLLSCLPGCVWPVQVLPGRGAPQKAVWAQGDANDQLGPEATQASPATNSNEL